MSNEIQLLGIKSYNLIRAFGLIPYVSINQKRKCRAETRHV